MRQFQGAVGEQLGKMRDFLAALEGSLDGEAERVRSEAGVALRRELGSLNSYLEQLRQMEKVLDEVVDKPQTEFLMVSTGRSSLSAPQPGFRPQRPHPMIRRGISGTLRSREGRDKPGPHMEEGWAPGLPLWLLRLGTAQGHYI